MRAHNASHGRGVAFVRSSAFQKITAAQKMTRALCLWCPQRYASRTHTPGTVSNVPARFTETVRATPSEDPIVLSGRALAQKLASLTRTADAEEAVRCLRLSLASLQPEAVNSQPHRFPWPSLATTLFICDARGDAESIALGLHLVEEVRTAFPLLIWEEENVLSVLLRLHAAAGHVQDSQHIFAFLLHRGQLKPRGASALVQLLCRVGDVQRAAQVWRACVERDIALSMTDYEALGRLCVAAREPPATLQRLLRTMAGAFATVSERLCEDVLEPWVGQVGAHRIQLPSPPPPLLSPARGLHGPQANAAVACADPEAPDTTTMVARRSTRCPHCDAELQPYRLTAPQRHALTVDLVEKVVAPRCQSNARARYAWDHWLRFLQSSSGSRSGSHAPFDVLIDGANVGYYGLSAWYDTAKARQHEQKGRRTSMKTNNVNMSPTQQDEDYGKRPGQSPGKVSAVDVGVDMELIDAAVHAATSDFGFRRPLVFLHERHVEPHNFLTPSCPAIVQRWRSLGQLYCVPRGINDDWCWLHAALTLGDPTAAPLCVLTNDEMRDHHFQLLHPTFFSRWRSQHQVRFRCRWVPADEGTPLAQRRQLVWLSPPSFAVALQESSQGWHIPFTAKGERHSALGTLAHATEDARTPCGHQDWLCLRSTLLCGGTSETDSRE